VIKTITKVGNSQGIIFDSGSARTGPSQPGDQLNVEVHDGGTITLTPLRPKPSRENGFQSHHSNDEALRRTIEETRVSATPGGLLSLTVDIIREIHSESISRFGGSEGMRDAALFGIGVAAPQPVSRDNLLLLI